ncbi:MAG: hypothetical protein KU38_03640 [Sulfurovum sp. FS08-3]|nr:MAG: hypothetical protein KU38_03640 [Sulfurovum sp. FS08-3]
MEGIIELIFHSIVEIGRFLARIFVWIFVEFLYGIVFHFTGYVLSKIFTLGRFPRGFKEVIDYEGLLEIIGLIFWIIVIFYIL